MALSITDLKRGTLCVYEGNPTAVEVRPKVMGRGALLLTCALRGLISGKVLKKPTRVTRAAKAPMCLTSQSNTSTTMLYPGSSRTKETLTESLSCQGHGGGAEAT